MLGSLEKGGVKPDFAAVFLPERSTGNCGLAMFGRQLKAVLENSSYGQAEVW
ncbi:MAG: hypothetical protein LBP22_09485 [Deltaproteobacteria bacterium]|jgi:hypothetical protein|nr:hypothetical protein [Deltaproteobacteria bacterium]